MNAVIAIEGVVIALLVVLVAGLLKSHAEILRKLSQLETGSPGRLQPQVATTGFGVAPESEITGVDPTGSSLKVSLTHGKGNTLLAFLTSGCASCRVFWDELGTAPALSPASIRPVVVTKGPGSESPSKVTDLAPSNVKVVMSDGAWNSFRVPLTPYFMLVDGDANILGEGSAPNLQSLLDLFAQSIADADPTRLSTGQREVLTDRRLSGSGVEPGDPSLYDDPLSQ